MGSRPYESKKKPDFHSAGIDQNRSMREQIMQITSFKAILARKLKPNLNVQSDSIRAEVFV